jgi:hypothetical protein
LTLANRSRDNRGRHGHRAELDELANSQQAPSAWSTRRIFEVADWRFEHLPE